MLFLRILSLQQKKIFLPQMFDLCHTENKITLKLVD